MVPLPDVNLASLGAGRGGGAGSLSVSAPGPDLAPIDPALGQRGDGGMQAWRPRRGAHGPHPAAPTLSKHTSWSLPPRLIRSGWTQKMPWLRRRLWA